MYDMALNFADLFQEITFCYVDQGRSESLHWKSLLKIVGRARLRSFLEGKASINVVMKWYCNTNLMHSPTNTRFRPIEHAVTREFPLRTQTRARPPFLCA